MHYRLFVTLDKDEAKDSLEARTEVVRKLLNDSSFYSPDSYSFFNGGTVADWFVVGGRWSGELSKRLWESRSGLNWYEEARKVMGIKKDAFGVSNKDLKNKDNQKKLQELWEKHGGEGVNPYDPSRDQYFEDGYEDDGMLLTQELYDLCLKEYEENGGRVEQTGNYGSWTDVHFQDISESFEFKPQKDWVGGKWLVVVDYHN